MATSITSVFKRIIHMKARRLLALFLLLVLPIISSLAQPAWFGGTPTVTPKVFSLDFNYGITTAGKVYVILINYNYTTPVPTSLDIKNGAIAGPSGGRISTWVIDVPDADKNKVFTLNAINQLGGNINLIPNHEYTFYFVAADPAGTPLQAAPIRILVKTLPCPSIFVLTGFDNSDRCVNPPGATKQYAFGFANNVYNGATWNISWGDGVGSYNFTSLADNQVPPNQSYTYNTHDSCIYEVTLTVQNPGACATIGQLVEKKTALLAGRDWDPDGNGDLVVEDVSTGVTDTIYVCEGYQTDVQVQDISTWDCQPGSYPDPPGEQNKDPRTLQWVYGGQVPNGAAGANLNTITGDVKVGSLGTAIKNGLGIIGDTVIRRSVGYQSEIMTIPATCVKNEIFKVWFKNWNVCNPFAGLEYNNSNYINTEIIIKVIATPPTPACLDIDVCEGATAAERTFHVTSGNVGTLSWYAQDPVLFPATPVVGVGPDFTAPVIPSGTSKDYWIVDGGSANHGVTCVSHPKKVTIYIRNGITNNTGGANETICTGTAPAVQNGSVPSGGAGAGTYAYRWESSPTGIAGSWSAAAGTNNTKDYTPGNLTETTYYHRRVTSSTCVDYSPSVKITVTPIPLPPTANAGSGAACTQITANWSSSADATSYRLDVSTVIGFGSFVPGYNNLNVGNVTTYNVTGLTAGTTYYYRVRAVNGCGTSPNSGTITYATLPATPAAPASQPGTNAACTSIDANWNASANATSYRLDVSTVIGFGSFVPGYNNLNVGNVTTYNVTGLTAGTTYYYRVRAVNSCGTSGNSATRTYATLPATPAAPAAQPGTNAACTSIDANWNASANATSYRLDVSMVIGFGSFVPGYNNLNVGNVTTYNVTGLTAGTTYYYRVRAVNTCGTSGNSGTITYATLPATPAAPASQPGTNAACTSIDANWNASVNATSYRLDVSTVIGFGSFVPGYNDLNVGNVTTYNVTGLTAGVTYYYRVRAVNSCGTSGNSGTITYATLPATPAAPVATAGTNAQCTQITANWNASVNATSYRLDVSTVIGFGSFVPGYQDLNVGNVTTYNVTGLALLTTYYYRVRAVNSCGTSANSNIITYATAVPPAPVATAGTNATCTTIDANWNAASGATSYRLDVSTVIGFGSFVPGYQDLNVGNVTTWNVTGLSTLTTYYYRVRAVSACGTSANSNVITYATAPSVAPVATAGTGAACTAINANWNASAGASSYRLDVSTVIGFGSFVPGYNDLNVGNVTTWNVTGLTAGTTYYYRVRAISICGTSGNSNIITYATLPATPAAPAAQAGTNAACTSIDANWSASVNATSYRLDVSTVIGFGSFVPGFNDLNVGNVLTWNVTGLTAGTTYYYRVRAVNSCGTSPNSGTITYATLPATPAAPAAQPGTNAACTSIDANWNASAGASSYRLDVSTVIGFGSFVPGYNDLNVGNVTTWNVTGLTAGTTYYYRVRAVNSCGTSANSGTITYATLPATPAAPAAQPGTNAACTSIDANWNASANATSYRLDVSTVIGFGSFVPGYNNLNVGNVTTYNVTGLTAGTTYYYRVRAVNTCGTSGNSGTITYATLPATPAAPAAQPGTNAACTSIDANWNASAGASSYRLDVSTVIGFGSFVPGYNDLNVGNVTTYNVTGLTAGVTYYYRVRAVNTCGTSGNSGTITYATLPATPAAPAAQPGSGATCTQITANWNASANATSYRLDVATTIGFTAGTYVPGFQDLNVGNVLTYNVPGLTAGVTYYYRVRAVNSCGTSASSGTITYPTLPATPAAPAAQPGSGATCTQITANWSASANATSYRLDVATTVTFTAGTYVPGFQDLNVGNVLTYNVPGLIAGVTYYYRVRAVNTCGTSASSGTITYPTLPATPAAPTAQPGSGADCSQITANWLASLNATSYRLDVSTVIGFGSFVPGYNDLNVGNVTTYNVTGLSAGTTYYYRVRAVNTCGTSGNSGTITYATLAATPAVPGAITGITAQCPALANQGYSISAVTDATTYTWTVPSGWSITSGQGTISLLVTTGSAGDNGNISVTAGNSCGTSAPGTMAVTVGSLSVAPTAVNIANNNTCVGTSKTLTFTGGGLGTGATWQWYTGSCGGTSAGSGTSLIVNPAAGSSTTYWVRAEGSCNTTACASNTVVVLPDVGTPGTPAPSITTICQGSAPTSYTTSAANATSYTWSVTGSGNTISGTGTTGTVTWDPAYTGTATVSVIANGCSGPSAPASTTVTVTPTVGTPVFAMGATSVRCQGADTITYSATATNSTGITYALDAASLTGSCTINAGTGEVIYPASWYGTTTITATAAGCNGPTIKTHVVTVNPLPLTSPIDGDAVLCEDATNKVYQVKLPRNAGSTYAWTVPASLNITSTPTYLYFIITDAVPGMAAPGDKVTVIETLPTGCVGDTIEFPVTIVEVIPGSVVNGLSTVCKGDTGVIYSVPDNPGSTYSWDVPPGAYITTTPTLHEISVTFNIQGTGQVNVTETSNGVCTRIHVPKNITINPLPTVFNLTSPLAYCATEPGVPITLSGSQVGVNYQLYNLLVPDGIEAGTGSPVIWADKPAGSYHAVATNATTGCVQQMNGTVVPTMNVVDGGTIGNDQAVCENTSPAAFASITPGTGVGIITYQWQKSPNNIAFSDIPGATSAIYASGAIATDTYFRRMTTSTLGSSVCSDFSDTLLITAIIFDPGSIGTNQDICEGSAPATAFTSVPASGVGIFTYQWLISTDGVNYTDIPGAESDTYTSGALLVDTWFKRKVTSTYMAKACVKETNAIKVTVINFTPGSIGSDQTICENTAPTPFTSVPATGDGSFAYSWESSPDNSSWTVLGVATPTYNSPNLTADTYFRRKVTSTIDTTSCVKYTITILVTVNDFDPGTISAAQTICENTAPMPFTSVAPAGDAAATFTFQWQSSIDGVNYSSISGATNATYTSGALSVDTYFRRQVTSTLNGKACIDFTPAILITVNNLTPGTISGTQTICEGAVPTPFTTTLSPTGDGTVAIQWQSSLDGTVFTDLGVTTPGYAPGALTADTWYRVFVTSAIGLNTCTDSTNVIKVTVNNFNPGSIGNDQTICENTAPVSLTSVTPTGDGTFSYKWLSSIDGSSFNQIPSAFSETYSPGSLTADMWYQRVVTSTLGVKACVDSTNVIKITVNNLTPGSIGSDQTICENGDPDPFTSVPPTYDGSVSYMWQSSIDGLTFTDLGATGETYDSPALTADTWFRRSVTSTIGANTCTKETGAVKVTVINFAPGSISIDQTICENTAPAMFTSVPASGDGSKAYQWEYSTDSLTYNNVPLGGTNPTYTSTALTQDTWFRRRVTATSGPASCTEYTDTIKVTVNNFIPGSIAGDQTICEGETPTAFTSVAPTGDGASYTYLWQNSLDGINFNNITGATGAAYAPGALTADTWYRRQVTSTLNGNQCTEITDTVRVTVNNLTPGTISGTQTICEGVIPTPFTTTLSPTGDGTVAIQWQSSLDGIVFTDLGVTTPGYAPGALTADTWYRVFVTSAIGLNTCTDSTNVIKVTVNNFVPGSIDADQTICENTAPSALTSMTPTGDGSFSYKWLRSTDNITFSQIPSALSETYSPGVLTADMWYQRVVTSTLGVTACVDSTNVIKITVNNLTPGSISADQTICENGDPDAFTSVPPTYDGTVSYMWQSSIDGLNFTDIGATGETYDSPALTADTWFRRSVTSTIGANACTKETGIIKVTVINFAPGSISIDQTICENTAPNMFTSVPASGDGSKAYQWEYSTDSLTYNNVPSGGTGATYTSTALTQDTWFRRRVTATSGPASCTEYTDTIKVTINNFIPGSIAGDQTICEGETPVAFTSVAPTGDGASYNFLWQNSLDGINFNNITGATGATYGPGALTADTWYRRQVTSTLNGNQCTEITDTVRVTVNNLTPGTISGTQTICEGAIPTPFTTTLSPTGDGTVAIQWQSSLDGIVFTDLGVTTPGYSPGALTADTWYRVFVTSAIGLNTCTDSTNVIKVTVNNFVPGSIDADQTICENTSAAALTSVTPTGDGSFSYKWLRSSDGIAFSQIPAALSETYSPGVLTVDMWYQRVVTSTLGVTACVDSTNVIKITVNNLTPGSILDNQTICENGDPNAFTSVTPTGDGSLSYQWYESLDGTVFTSILGATSETFDTTALTVDTWFRRAVTSTIGSNTCTKESNAVRVWVINFAPGTIGVDQTICEGSIPATFTGTPPAGDGVFTYTWESSLDSITWLPVGGASSSTYTAPALTVDTWYRRTVISTLNGQSCSEMTPPVKVTVNNFDPQTVAADQWICENDVPAPLTAVVPTGDGAFTFQWQSSLNGTVFSNITGETNPGYSPPALTADTWYRRQVTSTLNGNTCTEPTPAIKVTVNNVTAGSIGASQTICEGEVPIPFTSLTPTFDGTVSYEWQSSSDELSFAPIPLATGETYSPPALTADTWYKRIVYSTLPGVTCNKESNIIKITVNNFVPGSINADHTICEGSYASALTSVTPTGDGSFGYRWLSSSDGITFSAIPGAINETYNPGTLIADTWYSREVTSNYLGKPCIDTTNVVKVTVNNFNPGSIGASQTICEGETPAALASIITPAGDGAISFQWKYSNDGVNYLNISGANLETYAPGALTQDTWYIRSVTSTLNGTCTEETNFVKITVNNVIGGTIISDQTICNGKDPVPFMSIVHGNGDGVVTWQWQDSTSGVAFTDITISGNSLNYDSPALAQDTWFKRVTRSLLDGIECTGESNIVHVTVNEVYGGSIDTSQTICYGDTPAMLTSEDDGSGTGAVTYQWMRSNNGVIWNTISGETSLTYTPGIHYTDTYYKRVLMSTQNGILCPAESNVVLITVNPLPMATISGGETICPGETSNLTVNMAMGTGPFNLVINGTIAVNGYNSGDNIPVTPAATTTYTLTSVTDANGCNVTDGSHLFGSATVYVMLLPDITVEPGPVTTCEYGIVTFDVTATGTDPVYQWFENRGSGFSAVVDTGLYYGANAKTLYLFGATRDMNGYIYHVVVSNCTNSDQSVDVILNVNTVAEIEEQPKDTTICSTDNAAFGVVATGTNLTYDWQVKIGAAAFASVVNGGVYSGQGTDTLRLTGVPGSYNNYLFRLIVKGTCGSAMYSSFAFLRVNVPPTVTKQPNNAKICDKGGPVYFLSNGSGMIDSLRWQVSADNGISWADIYDNAIYSGTTTQQLALIDVPVAYNNYQYRLALKAFCAYTYSNGAVLTVNPLPAITFASDPLPACGNTTLTLTPIITSGSGTWTQHVWTGDVGPLNNYFIQNPTFKTLVGGPYTLYYKVKDSNGCYGNDTLTVVVEAPDATFIQDVNMGCTPAPVNFTKDMTGFASWSWDFGDGTPVNTTDANPVHVFTNTTVSTILYRTVKLTVTSTVGGCTDTKQSMMTVYPAVDAAFTSSDDSICSGSQLTFTALPGANMYTWDFGDGVSGPGGSAVQHLYTNASGTPLPITVQLVTSSFYGCTDTTTLGIVVMPLPQAQFSPSPTTQNYIPAGNNVTFTDLTTPASASWTYDWDFDDGGSSTAQSPTHTYTGIGTYDVVLTVSNEKCSSSISHPVNVTPEAPIANFDSIPSGCAPLYIEISNTTVNKDTPGTTFLWDFDDGSTSTAENPTYTYFTPGSYNIMLTVTGPGGISTKEQVVHAYISPQAYFEVTPTLVYVNDERVRCFNHTQFADSYLWDFGDGDTSKMEEPYHKYMEEGVYDITLWAYSANGCSDKFVLSPAVTVEPPGEVRFSTVFTPNKEGPIERTDLPTGGTEIDQFFFPPIREKVINYKLQIFNRQGMLIFQSNSINIPWNGYYKGKLCPQGVYVWYVEGKYANGKPFKAVGDITLLH
jgi:hypothetical protein